jgi:hypothetical protein
VTVPPLIHFIIYAIIIIELCTCMSLLRTLIVGLYLIAKKGEEGDIKNPWYYEQAVAYRGTKLIVFRFYTG